MSWAENRYSENSRFFIENFALTISKPLSAGQAQTYHAREFASGQANYWSRDQQGHSQWQGRLAQQWSLQGAEGC